MQAVKHLRSVMCPARRYIVLVLYSALVVIAFANPGFANERNSSLRILTIGDSLMAWNAIGKGSIPDVMELVTGAELVDRSRIASFVLTGGIAGQYIEGDWDWVVVTGGGNDLWMGCGCQRCENSLDAMISSNGKSGRIADLLLRARAEGARVIYVGYLRSPGINTPIEHCKADGDELERRIELFARNHPDIYYISLVDLVPFGALNYLSFDRIHPSRFASFFIAERIIELINTQSKH